MSKRWLLLGFILLLVALTAFFLQDFARFIADWFVSTYQIVSPYFASIPQPIIWVFFILIILFILADSMIGREHRRPADRRVEKSHLGRVGVWTRWIQQATRRSSRRAFYKAWLAQNVAQLADEIEAHNSLLSPGQDRQPLGVEEPGMPPEIAAYLEAGQTALFHRRFDLPRLLGLKKKGFPLDVDLERVVGFLEEQLEVQRDE